MTRQTEPSRRRSNSLPSPNTLFPANSPMLHHSAPHLGKEVPSHHSLSPIELMFYSTTDLQGSAVFYPEASKIASVTIAKKVKPKFNWRIAFSAKSIMIGLGSFVYSSGSNITYQCLPPLGKATGENFLQFELQH